MASTYTNRALRAAILASQQCHRPSISHRVSLASLGVRNFSKTHSHRAVFAPAPSLSPSTSAQPPPSASSSSLASPSKIPVGGQPLVQHMKMVASPTADELEEVEIYESVLSPEEASMKLTDRAAEQLQRISVRENDPNAALRVLVESGGCHGYQYKMDLVSGRNPEDYLFTHPSIQPSNVVIDAVSLPLIKGSTLDYATELIGSTFRVVSNPQSKGNGCGCGVSWELKDS